MDVYIFLFLGLFSRFTGTDGQQKSYIAESANVFTTAFLKYNKYFRPYNESSDPVQVNVRVDFVRILDVDTDASSMTSIVDIRLQWVDGRLYWYSDIIKHVTVNSTEVWTPDVYFLNMESRPEILIEPRFLTIESTGKVYWYQRAKLRTPCTTESEGEFSCSVTFGSMQFPQSELDFKRIICDNPENKQKLVKMTAPSAPIGWSSTRMNMHFKPVTPKKVETGMYYNLHKNVKKSLLPKEVQNMETQSVDLARRILHRQRQKSFRISQEKYRKIISQGSTRVTVVNSEPGIRPTSTEDLSRSLYLPPVGRHKPNTPMTPGSRYTADDVRSIVDRLSTYDPCKVPESRGQFIKLPPPIVYKKKYSEDEVQSIVDRLSEYNPLKGPAESKGIPTIVRRTPRQSMVPPQKCTSDEVEDIVERLCMVHFDTPIKETRYVPTPYPLSARS
ncbi:uncharacterized protein LOC125646536 isoform X2 [Ostrea edulis]|uniref:uncharacterized protein LOC125646536 isoform X2 n=1 Tax=Ostrea edulis TaxID=37623 RepID=UPI0024AF4307|nr:uncharacterized protein LOC125646536 isoform X2 [Ostrea edulis]